MLLHMSVVTSCLLLRSDPLYKCNKFVCLCLSVDGHLCDFQCLVLYLCQSDKKKKWHFIIFLKKL